MVLQWLSLVKHDKDRSPQPCKTLESMDLSKLESQLVGSRQRAIGRGPHQIKNDVCGSHEGSCFKSSVSTEQHHMLKTILLEEATSNVVIACHHPQWIRLCPLWHAAQTLTLVESLLSCAVAAHCWKSHESPCEAAVQIPGERADVFLSWMKTPANKNVKRG